MKKVHFVIFFLIHRYWHPYIHFLSLSFTPTAMIALTPQLEMPEFQFHVHNAPSMFAYPEKVSLIWKAIIYFFAC